MLAFQSAALRSPARHLALIAATLVSGLAGFTEAAAQPSNLKPVTIVLEWTAIQPQHFGFWLAKERGWYAEEGLDVTIRSSGGSAQAMQIVTGGQAEFGNVAASALAAAKGKGAVPLKMVAVFGQRDSLSIAYFESSGIREPKDLEGRKVGVVPGSMPHLLWPSFAETNGIDTSKVEVMHWDFRSYWGIMGAKQVDASLNFTLGSTGQHIFRQRGEIVHQFVFSDYIPLVGSGVIVRDDLLENDPDTIQRFVRATVRAWNYLAESPDEAVPEAAEIITSNLDELPPASVLAEYAYEVIPEKMTGPTTAGTPTGYSSPEEWAEMFSLLKQSDPSITNEVTPDDMMTNRFVE